MYEHDATEIAYRNGYEAGKKEAIKEIEANGEWVHLPCKVGDTIWFDTYDYGEPIGIQPHKVIDITHTVCIKDDGDLFVTKINISDFGKDTFLTKEEAVSALEKIKGEKEMTNEKALKDALDAINSGMLDLSDINPYIETIKEAIEKQIPKNRDSEV